MSRRMDYIFDVSEGWVSSKEIFERVLGKEYTEDHNEAIKNAGYPVNISERIVTPALIIDHYRGSFELEYPYLLSVSDDVDINLVLIPNLISLQKCIASLVSSSKAYFEATKS